MTEPLSDAKADELISTAHEVIDASRQATGAVLISEEKARTAKRRFIAIIIIMLLGFGGLYTRQQISNHNIITGRDASRAILRQIADCLDPKGKCAKAGADGQVQLITKLLNSTTVIAGIAASCAPDYVNLPRPARDQAILKCISDGVAKLVH